MLTRRSLLATSAAALAAPSLARATGARVMKFISQSDLTVPDPIWTTAYVTRNHGLLVFDTLYGTDARYAVQSQMLAGHNIGNDGKEWRMTLRPGLKFHDGTPVLAAIASPASSAGVSATPPSRPSWPTPTNSPPPTTKPSCSS